MHNPQKGPYWNEEVIGGGKYALCCENGHTVEESGEVIKDHLAAYENDGGYDGLVAAVIGPNLPTLYHNFGW